MARKDDVWTNKPWGYIQTTWVNGYDVLVNGTDKYLNFAVLSWTNGYWFRDLAGQMQFKHNSGTRADIWAWDWLFNGNTLWVKKTMGSIDNYDIGFITNNLERMTILNSGLVGIGNATPTSLLDVGAYNTSYYTIRTGDFVLQPYALNNGFISDNAYFSWFGWTRLNAGYAVGFQFYNGQLLLFNTPSGSWTFTPLIPFKIDSANGGVVALGWDISYVTGDYTGAKMVVLANGRVGIWTITPGAQLHVVGATTTSTIELGHATDTTISRVSAGVLAVEGIVVDTIATSSEASNTTPTVAITATRMTHLITAQSAAAAFGIPTTTIALDNNNTLVIRIKDNWTARALTWNAIFRASTDLALPATTVLWKTLYLWFKYNLTDTKRDMLALLNNIT